MQALDSGIDAFIKHINKELTKGEQINLPEIQDKKQHDLSNIISFYVGAFKNRYGAKSRPDVGGKSLGALKRIMKDFSNEQTLKLIEVYLKMDDDRFVSFGHDLCTLDINRQKVLLFATGSNTKKMTNIEKAAKEAGILIPEGL